MNDSLAKGTSIITQGTDSLDAIKSAMVTWQSVPTAAIRFADLRITSLQSSAPDEVNLVTMAETPVNRRFLGPGDGTVALTRVVFNVTTGKISEADVILNSLCRFSTNLAAGTYDLQSILTHELGHVLGCDHAVAQNDTMFAVTGFREFFQRYLSPDSVSFATFTYPETNRLITLGRISGTVRKQGQPVFGASVTAMDLQRNLIYTSLSEPDGSFSITGPIAGKYAVVVEPLNGPTAVEDLVMQGSDAYYRNLNATFRTLVRERDMDDDEDDDEIVLDEVETDLDFELSSKAATLNIDRLGRGDPETGAGFLAVGTVVVNPGERFALLIGGSGVSKVTKLEDVRILGSGMVIDSSRPVKVLRNDLGKEVGISVVVDVAQDASPGPRTILLRSEDEQVVSTGGILVFQRALPALTLYMPYFITSPDQYTGLALANTASVPASVKIASRDSQGALIYDQDAIVPADLSIAAGAQTARLERQIFNLPPSSQQSGTITLESDTRELQGFYLSGDLKSTYLDGAEAFTQAYKQLYFIDVLQNARTVTEVHLMNVKDAPLPVTLRLVGADGKTLRGPLSRTIPPRGKIGDPVSSIFGYSGDLSSAHVVASAGIEALAGFGLTKQKDTVFGMNAVPPERAGAMLYSPHLAVGHFAVNYSTRLNIVNIGASASSVAIELLGDDGDYLPGARLDTPVAIPAGAHRTVDIGTCFGLSKFPTQGAIRVVANSGAKLLANIIFGDGNPSAAQLSFAAALTLSATGANRFLFSQVAQGQGFYTGVAFMAPVGAEVRIQVFDSAGKVTGSTSMMLLPCQRHVSLLHDLIPTTGGQVGGYVKVTSTNPVVAFELFGSTSGQFLSAVPLQRLPE
jgi:hypothetical protein